MLQATPGFLQRRQALKRDLAIRALSAGAATQYLKEKPRAAHTRDA